MSLLSRSWPVLITQLLSICIAGTAISSTYLAQYYGVECPGLQSTLTYAALTLIYLPLYAFKGILQRCEKINVSLLRTETTATVNQGDMVAVWVAWFY